jgi:hypothetical protein
VDLAVGHGVVVAVAPAPTSSAGLSVVCRMCASSQAAPHCGQDSTERPESIEAGSVRPAQPPLVIDDEGLNERLVAIPYPFRDGKVSERIAASTPADESTQSETGRVPAILGLNT